MKRTTNSDLGSARASRAAWASMGANIYLNKEKSERIEGTIGVGITYAACIVDK